ncbi:MAG: nucleotidyl transferase AbiEii/AbiGii toxin family protein [Bacteroidota bacterium]
MQDEELKNFRLVGGTALSLCMGHRISIDIDLFTNQDFDAPKLYERLQNYYKGEKLRAIKNGVFGLIDDIKIDLIAHQYPWLKPVNEIEGIRMASLEDIGAMKVHAIVQSGSRFKDFVDVYYLLEHLSNKELIDTYQKKYPDTNPVLAQNALIYFSDIDFDIPVNLMEKKLDWNKIARRLQIANLDNEKLFKPERR